MKTDHLYYPYHSQRMTTIARQGMVATSQPLAAQAGLDMLKKGGNAVDAAIATAAMLTVVEPTSNGIGGDAFALVWMKDKLYGLNASGPAPQSISIDKVRELGHDEMPLHGFLPVTVPGAPGGWAALSKRFGKLPLIEVLQPAIYYAENGFAVTPTVAKLWERAYKKFSTSCTEPMYNGWFDTFAPNGEYPKIGDIWRSPDHADTLRQIARTDAAAFYEGELASKMTEFSADNGGFLTKEDLAAYEPDWVEPISVNYRGYDVWEIPPNGQGLVALSALNILKGFSFQEKESIDTYHKQMEAMKLAFADGHAYITEEQHMPVTVEELLSDAYAAKRRNQIGETAQEPEAGEPKAGGTVYLAAADSDGNMVSFIQSNYHGFGSGLVVPGTGIALQNRGHNFSLDPEHANSLQGGKKSFHTIIPGFLTKDNQAIGPFGVMGGFMQPQGHAQVVMNMLDFGLNPQTALDAPRWQWIKDKTFHVEADFPKHIAEALIRKGHDIEVKADRSTFGRGQVIWRDPENGTLYGGTEARADGSIASY